MSGTVDMAEYWKGEYGVLKASYDQQLITSERVERELTKQINRLQADVARLRSGSASTPSPPAAPAPAPCPNCASRIDSDVVQQMAGATTAVQEECNKLRSKVVALAGTLDALSAALTRAESDRDEARASLVAAHAAAAEAAARAAAAEAREKEHEAAASAAAATAAVVAVPLPSPTRSPPVTGSSKLREAQSLTAAQRRIKQLEAEVAHKEQELEELQKGAGAAAGPSAGGSSDTNTSTAVAVLSQLLAAQTQLAGSTSNTDAAAAAAAAAGHVTTAITALRGVVGPDAVAAATSVAAAAAAAPSLSPHKLLPAASNGAAAASPASPATATAATAFAVAAATPAPTTPQLQQLHSPAAVPLQPSPSPLTAAYEALLHENVALVTDLAQASNRIAVVCRVRPLTAAEVERDTAMGASALYPNALPPAAPTVDGDSSSSNSSRSLLQVYSPQALGLWDRSRKSWRPFALDRVLPPTAGQEEVFSHVAPLAQLVVEGYNACVLAYGITGSGKTHTMIGSPDGSSGGPGVTARMLTRLFDLLPTATGAATATAGGAASVVVKLSMLEVYNEELRDLLLPPGAAPTKLEVRTINPSATTASTTSTAAAPATPSSSSSAGAGAAAAASNAGPTVAVQIPGLTDVPVRTAGEAMALIAQGLAVRATAVTDIHEHSSRSHCIIRLQVEVAADAGLPAATAAAAREAGLPPPFTTLGRLYLVDLAGSERVRKSAVTGSRLREAQAINRSLSCLGDVLAALDKKAAHVPYRNSKLTHILQDSLGGRARTVLLCAVCPSAYVAEETLFSLQFAARARRIDLGPARKTVQYHNLLDQYSALKRQYAAAEHERQAVIEALHASRAANKQLEARLAALRQTSHDSLLSVTRNAVQQVEVSKLDAVGLADALRVEQAARRAVESRIEAAVTDARLALQARDAVVADLQRCNARLDSAVEDAVALRQQVHSLKCALADTQKMMAYTRTRHGDKERGKSSERERERERISTAVTAAATAVEACTISPSTTATTAAAAVAVVSSAQRTSPGGGGLSSTGASSTRGGAAGAGAGAGAGAWPLSSPTTQQLLYQYQATPAATSVPTPSAAAAAAAAAVPVRAIATSAAASRAVQPPPVPLPAAAVSGSKKGGRGSVGGGSTRGGATGSAGATAASAALLAQRERRARHEAEQVAARKAQQAAEKRAKAELQRLALARVRALSAATASTPAATAVPVSAAAAHSTPAPAPAPDAAPSTSASAYAYPHPPTTPPSPSLSSSSRPSLAASFIPLIPAADAVTATAFGSATGARANTGSSSSPAVTRSAAAVPRTTVASFYDALDDGNEDDEQEDADLYDEGYDSQHQAVESDEEEGAGQQQQEQQQEEQEAPLQHEEDARAREFAAVESSLGLPDLATPAKAANPVSATATASAATAALAGPRLSVSPTPPTPPTVAHAPYTVSVDLRALAAAATSSSSASSNGGSSDSNNGAAASAALAPAVSAPARSEPAAVASPASAVAPVVAPAVAARSAAVWDAPLTAPAASRAPAPVSAPVAAPAPAASATLRKLVEERDNHHTDEEEEDEEEGGAYVPSFSPTPAPAPAPAATPGRGAPSASASASAAASASPYSFGYGDFPSSPRRTGTASLASATTPAAARSVQAAAAVSPVSAPAPAPAAAPAPAPSTAATAAAAAPPVAAAAPAPQQPKFVNFSIFSPATLAAATPSTGIVSYTPAAAATPTATPTPTATATSSVAHAQLNLDMSDDEEAPAAAPTHRAQHEEEDGGDADSMGSADTDDLLDLLPD